MSETSDPAGRGGLLYRRLVLSEYDLREAAESHACLMALDEFHLQPPDQRPETAAHLTRMVVAYARPFGANKSKGARAPKTAAHLPDKMRAAFSNAEETMHRRLLELRHREFAHSDAGATGVSIAVILGTPPTVSAVSRRPRLLFTRDEMLRIRECIRKLRRAIADKRRDLEPGIIGHIGPEGSGAER